MTQNKHVRVRFAPSPTGPLHIGGVRTALYNYLFARKHGGDFILRIEDTDQSRYVEGAEEYILQSLNWLGLVPDESVDKKGNCGPYRQSERKNIYETHLQQLIESGHAYYAFDTPEDLEKMREREKEKGVHTPKYDQSVRMSMKNSLSLSKAEVDNFLAAGENITVRMKVPENEVISFEDSIRGTVSFNSAELDDKVILKADGLPTYHLANVVDDKLMSITHVIRGEEWLSSSAHHVLLYRSFGWIEDRPVFAHLPLILKPSGKGKLSKRDGAKFGFPVFPLEWYDRAADETFAGFRESGFLPAALLNFLSLLGWNPGTDQEIFSMDELAGLFEIEQINKSGAQFNYDKVQWFNQQYINASSSTDLYELVKERFDAELDGSLLRRVIELLKPRVTFLEDFHSKSTYFFERPESYDEKSLVKKFKIENRSHFEQIAQLILNTEANSLALQALVKEYITTHSLKFGDIFPVLRIFIAGTMEGPDLFEMMVLIGLPECSNRIQLGIDFVIKS